jgi:hypothetical protein
MRRNGGQRLLRSALPALGPEPVFFDVGGNVGKWSTWAAAVAPGEDAIDVIQFEYGGTYLDAGRRLGGVVGLFPDGYRLVPWGVIPLTQEDLRDTFLLSNYAALSPRLR